MLPPPQRHRQAAANPLSCCRHRLAAAKLPPTSRFRAAANATAAALLPPRCRRCAVDWFSSLLEHFSTVL